MAENVAKLTIVVMEKQMSSKRIWVDADACPVVIKEILFKAAIRCKIYLTFVANQNINVPANKFIDMIRVSKGFDVADNAIVDKITKGNLLITADIPLAADAIAKGAIIISPRGEYLTDSNIKAKLTMRNFMEDLRNSGVNTSGPAAMSSADTREFSKHLDKYLQS